ncbi:myb protein X isoform X1 [Biomphalaria glabrata]|nr:myb protein X isoform X1 [Biomphalaria glabrata]
MARMYFGFLNCLLFSVCLMACMDLMKAYPDTQNGVEVTPSLDLDNLDLDLDQEDNLDLNLEAEDSKTTKALPLTTGNPPKDLSLKLYNLDLDQPSIDDLGLDLFEKADKSSSINENRPEAKVEPDSNSPIKLNNITSKPEQDNINNDDIKVEYNETESIDLLDDLNLSKNVPESDLFLEEDDDNVELAEDDKVITTEKPSVDRENNSNYKTEAGKTEDLVKAKDEIGLSNLIAPEDEDKHYQYKDRQGAKGVRTSDKFREDDHLQNLSPSKQIQRSSNRKTLLKSQDDIIREGSQEHEDSKTLSIKNGNVLLKSKTANLEEESKLVPDKPDATDSNIESSKDKSPLPNNPDHDTISLSKEGTPVKEQGRKAKDGLLQKLSSLNEKNFLNQENENLKNQSQADKETVDQLETKHISVKAKGRKEADFGLALQDNVQDSRGTDRIDTNLPSLAKEEDTNSDSLKTLIVPPYRSNDRRLNERKSKLPSFSQKSKSKDNYTFQPNLPFVVDQQDYTFTDTKLLQYNRKKSENEYINKKVTLADDYKEESKGRVTTQFTSNSKELLADKFKSKQDFHISHKNSNERTNFGLPKINQNVKNSTIKSPLPDDDKLESLETETELSLSKENELQSKDRDNQILSETFDNELESKEMSTKSKLNELEGKLIETESPQLMDTDKERKKVNTQSAQTNEDEQGNDTELPQPNNDKLKIKQIDNEAPQPNDDELESKPIDTKLPQLNDDKFKSKQIDNEAPQPNDDELESKPIDTELPQFKDDELESKQTDTETPQPNDDELESKPIDTELPQFKDDELESKQIDTESSQPNDVELESKQIDTETPQPNDDKLESKPIDTKLPQSNDDELESKQIDTESSQPNDDKLESKPIDTELLQSKDDELESKQIDTEAPHHNNNVLESKHIDTEAPQPDDVELESKQIDTKLPLSYDDDLESKQIDTKLPKPSDDEFESKDTDNKIVKLQLPGKESNRLDEKKDSFDSENEESPGEDIVNRQLSSYKNNLNVSRSQENKNSYKGDIGNKPLEDENETEREGDDENYTDNNDDNEESKSDYVNREGEEVDETPEEDDHDIEPDEHYDTNKWFKPGNKEKVAADIDNTENVVDDFDEDEIRKQANFSKHPTAPSSMVLLYTWMIVAILIVVVGISTYQSRCKGLKFPFLSKKSSHGEDKKRLLDHEFV